MWEFSKDNQVELPKSKRSYLIPADKWNEIKKKTKEIGRSASWIKYYAGLLFGVAIASLLATVYGYIYLDSNLPQIFYIPFHVFWLIILLLSASHILPFLYFRRRQRYLNNSREYILDIMYKLDGCFLGDDSED